MIGLRRLIQIAAMLVTTLGLLAGMPARAHEVRPALLQITEHKNGSVDVIFKQPAAAMLVVKLEPEISGNLLAQKPPQVASGSGFITRSWTDLDTQGVGISGRTVKVSGLEQTITDTLLIINFQDGYHVQEILRPTENSYEVARRGNALPITTYGFLGVEHILTGYDHLAFVLGLILLVKGAMTLLKTISAFTVAHSITLAATSLGYISVSPAKIEALVALSILFVAVELVGLRRGRASITHKYPWIIAFAFGLLHGSAFAGALQQIGLPPANIPIALLFFNIGVEAGQLIFIGAVFALAFTLFRLPIFKQKWAEVAPIYLIGIFSVFWLAERFHTAIFPS